MNVGSLFAGIGGFDLGLERAGFTTVWQVEKNPYRRAVLAQQFPTAVRHVDVRTVGAGELGPVDLVCGGFPCQDISQAGRGAGLAGSRSGLWFEFARIVGELRPPYVVVENLPALRRRGLDRILGDLAALGYDAEWDCIPARAVGAHHRRDRLWLVAYPDESRSQGPRPPRALRPQPRSPRGDGDMADAQVIDLGTGLRTDRAGALGRRRLGDQGGTYDTWPAEPDVGRVAYGVPARVDRIAALGDSLVPAIAQWIGERILEYEAAA